ncbi:MAG: rhamnosidase [Verrucomicrobiaceae bacterium]|nr:MAG: rhamnosidase [Verrucomicrobiaceae bacterium]
MPEKTETLLHKMKLLPPVVITVATLLASLPAYSSNTPEPRSCIDRAADKSYTGDELLPSYLRCEYLVNPLGVGSTEPRLSWVVESGKRGQSQTAYRVLVAGSKSTLDEDKGDLWDSGKVSSSDTTAIIYAGKPLNSGQPCFWKVKVWDAAGKESPWSAPARWSTGLLNPSDWQAQWIGYDKPRQAELPEADFERGKWIWFAGDSFPEAALGTRVFVGSVKLPPVNEISRAEILIASGGGFSVNLNGQRVGLTKPSPNDPRRASIFNALEYLKDGDNEIRATVENAEKGPAGLILKFQVETKSGKTITLVTDESWLATDKTSADAGNRDEWTAPRVLGEHGIKPWGRLPAAGKLAQPAAYLRKEFTVEKPVVRATLYTVALGWIDAHLNGSRVSDDYFNPGWTDYHKRVYYRAYDVTGAIRPGPNALGTILSDGWYSGYIGWYGKREHYGNQPRALAQLVLEFADGSRQVVATGPGWKAATGPITSADILQGETYDARKELTGWDRSGFDDSSWAGVDTGANLSPVLQAHTGPPVVAIKEFRAKSITEPEPGVYVFDLGQNFAGVPRIKVNGKPGQKITLRHAERLAPDGGVYTINLRSAAATDSYICKGGGIETWSPRFTFHGFQYIEVAGLTEKPDEDTVVGVALSSDTPVAGAFECSDPMLNQLHNNIYWTQRANFIDVPTDCPQRDERLGWTGDAQIYIRTATLNTDVQAFFAKWLVDLQDAQRADGQFPRVAPVQPLLSNGGDDGGPAWADVGVVCPWTIYDVYGDTRELAAHYDSMCRFIEFCKDRCTPDLLPPPKFHCFGDWVSIKADTPKDVIFMAYFAHSTKLLARSAEALGKTEDAAKYNALFERIKESFNKAYVGADGRIKGDTQAVYVLALAYDLVTGENAKLAAKYLAEDIEKHDWHLTTGFVGTKDLMLVLAKIGRNDIACRLVHNDTFPSWGFSIKCGATSIWERWDGWTPENGFEKSGMNSFAHYSFGAVYQWMVENLGGIRNDTPAYKTITIAPAIDEKLDFARTVYAGIRGKITSEWKKDGDNLLVNVTIPANTTATVSLPAKSAESITEGGHPLDKAESVKFLRTDGDRSLLSVESGSYAFAVKDGK